MYLNLFEYSKISNIVNYYDNLKKVFIVIHCKM